MNKIIPIAIIGSNRAYGCPTRTGHQEFDAYFRDFTIKNNAIVALSSQTFSCMPVQSPPFPCRDTYIIASSEECSIDKTLSQTIAVNNLSDLLIATIDKKKDLYVFLDQKLHQEFFEYYRDHFEEIIVGQLDKDFEGEHFFPELPIFDWRPLMIHEVKSQGLRSPGFKIFKYTRQLFSI